MTEQQATLMNKKIGTLALGLALLSLTGCGLKGPLYFPPADKDATQKTSVQRQQELEQAQKEAAEQQSMEQSTTPNRNDRGLTTGPTQVLY